MSATEDELLAALRLARSAEIGPVTFRNLIDRFGSACAAIEELPAISRTNGRASQIRLAPAKDAARELEQAQDLGIRFLIHRNDDYPPLLAQCDGAPAVLAVRGTLAVLGSPAVAIVGARNASANGRKLAEALAAGLGARDYVVVSGLARGVDAAAHKGSLATGTIAVLAGGVDQVYPEEHRDLYEQIVANGCVLSEMPLGHVARSQDFPRRNRIIAGISLGTIVVEAAERSGSLITARLAGEMGREVFAVPGSPLDERCRGTNRLLKDGAVLTETVDDVIANLPSEPRIARLRTAAQPTLNFMGSPRSDAPRPVNQAPAGNILASRVVELLGFNPVPIDDLVRQTGATASEVQAVLFDLEIEGFILRHPGQAVSRASQAGGP